MAVWPRVVSFFSNPDAFMSKLEAYRTRDSHLAEIKAEEAVLKRKEETTVEQERALLTYELDGFYAPNVLAEKKRELEALRKQVSGRRQELRRRTRSEEQRSATVASASTLYQEIRGKLESPSYATKAELYKLLINKIVLSGDKAEVWLNVPLAEPERLTSRPFVDCAAIASADSSPDWSRSYQTGSMDGLVVFTAQLPVSQSRGSVARPG